MEENFIPISSMKYHLSNRRTEAPFALVVLTDAELVLTRILNGGRTDNQNEYHPGVRELSPGAYLKPGKEENRDRV